MTDARVTQVVVEEWSDNNPSTQVTQIAVEQWSAVFALSGSAVVTQVAVEEWGVYPATSTGRKRRLVAIIM